MPVVAMVVAVIVAHHNGDARRELQVVAAIAIA
jgi:hypothetical protein